MFYQKFLSASALSMSAVMAAAPAYAQDHSQMDHSQHQGHVMPTTADPTPPMLPLPPQGEKTTQPQPQPQAHDHSKMNHGNMDNGKSNNPPQDHDAHDNNSTVLNFVTGSGTSRLPGNEGGMHGLMTMAGDWHLMAHGFVQAAYTDHGGPRGDDKFYVTNMAMFSASREFDGGKFEARTMMSLEPAMSRRGYPNLFATGETAYGEPLIDRQHPHDLFMELAARVDIDIADNTSAFLYGGPVGEPSIGPSAFMHRASAKYNPEPPITHHWFDSTHITYGVVTAGISSKLFQIEASAFRGREPDEERWNIETPKLDSWSVRATVNPSAEWSAQISTAHLKSPEAFHGGDEQRTTASIHYANENGLSAMAAFSAKDKKPGPTLTAWLAEANYDITKRHTVFARYENVKNDELFPDHDDALHDRPFRVAKMQAGYAYRLPVTKNIEVALGGSLAAYAKPDALDPYYGKSPLGYTVFTKLTLGQ